MLENTSVLNVVCLDVAPVVRSAEAARLSVRYCCDGFSVAAADLPRSADGSVTAPKCYV